MPTLNIPYTFQNGQVADGAHVSANFAAIKSVVEAITENATHTGDVTGSTALTIATDAVVTAKIKDANVTAAKLATDVNTKVLLAGDDYSLTDGSTIAVDWSNGATQKVTLGGTGRTITFANPVAGQVYRLIIKQDGTGSRTITTWPTIRWAGGSAPTLTTTASKADIVTLLYDGTDYFGSVTQNF